MAGSWQTTAENLNNIGEFIELTEYMQDEEFTRALEMIVKQRIESVIWRYTTISSTTNEEASNNSPPPFRQNMVQKCRSPQTYKQNRAYETKNRVGQFEVGFGVSSLVDS